MQIWSSADQFRSMCFLVFVEITPTCVYDRSCIWVRSHLRASLASRKLVDTQYSADPICSQGLLGAYQGHPKRWNCEPVGWCVREVLCTSARLRGALCTAPRLMLLDAMQLLGCELTASFFWGTGRRKNGLSCRTLANKGCQHSCHWQLKDATA